KQLCNYEVQSLFDDIENSVTNSGYEMIYIEITDNRMQIQTRFLYHFNYIFMFISPLRINFIMSVVHTIITFNKLRLLMYNGERCFSFHRMPDVRNMFRLIRVKHIAEIIFHFIFAEIG